jgi:hypothetical protein
VKSPAEEKPRFVIKGIGIEYVVVSGLHRFPHVVA